MDQRELIEYVGKRKQENLDTIRRKNSDYATEADPFWNFRLCEILGVCSTETGLLVRILDKYARIINQIVTEKSYAVEEEDIHNTLGDSSNYCDLLDAYLVAKKRGELLPLPRITNPIELVTALRIMGIKTDIIPTDDPILDDRCFVTATFPATNSNYAKERAEAVGGTK